MTEAQMGETFVEPTAHAHAAEARAPEVAAVEVKVKADRRKSTLDLVAKTLTITEADGVTSTTYEVASLPANVQTWLMLNKLGDVIRAGGSYEGLAKGELPTRTVGKPEAINPWRQALANALVDLTKKTPAPMSAADALAKSLSLTTAEVHGYKTDVSVVRHYNNIMGKVSVSLGSLAS